MYCERHKLEDYYFYSEEVKKKRERYKIKHCRWDKKEKGRRGEEEEENEEKRRGKGRQKIHKSLAIVDDSDSCEYAFVLPLFCFHFNRICGVLCLQNITYPLRSCACMYVQIQSPFCLSYFKSLAAELKMFVRMTDGLEFTYNLTAAVMSEIGCVQSS